MLTTLFQHFEAVIKLARVFAGDQISSRDEEGGGLFDSFHGEGEEGHDGIVGVN